MGLGIVLARIIRDQVLGACQERHRVEGLGRRPARPARGSARRSSPCRQAL